MYRPAPRPRPRAGADVATLSSDLSVRCYQHNNPGLAPGFCLVRFHPATRPRDPAPVPPSHRSPPLVGSPAGARNPSGFPRVRLMGKGLVLVGSLTQYGQSLTFRFYVLRVSDDGERNIRTSTGRGSSREEDDLALRSQSRRGDQSWCGSKTRYRGKPNRQTAQGSAEPDGVLLRGAPRIWRMERTTRGANHEAAKNRRSMSRIGRVADGVVNSGARCRTEDAARNDHPG